MPASSSGRGRGCPRTSAAIRHPADCGHGGARRWLALAGLALSALVAGVYLGNGVLELFDLVPPSNLLEAVARLRLRGRDAYPAYAGRWQELPTGEVPLGGVRGVPTALDSESGTWVIYDSDEFGFRNPPGAWQPPVRIALLGDSFVHGFGAADGEDLAGVFRQHEVRTLNLGRSRTGPLSQLALAREYLPAVRPEVVVSFFFEGNDLLEAVPELENPVLRRYYFEPGFTQELRAHADRVDAGVRGLFDERYRGWLAQSGAEASLPVRLLRLSAARSLWARARAVRGRTATPASSCHAWWRRLRLSQVAIGDALEPTTPAPIEPAVAREMRRTDPGADDGLAQQLRRSGLLLAASRYVPLQGSLVPAALYGSILTQLDALVRSWGGTLVLVYLPAAETARDPTCDPNRALVRDIAQSRRIPFVDVTDAFAGRSDLDALYRVHLTPAGCRLVGDYVFGRLP